jgi:hypothetical protein
MSEMSKLALATLLQVEDRCDSLGWGYILAYDDGEAEALVYSAGAEKPTFKGAGKNSCEALERLAEDIVDADLKYTERKVKDDAETEGSDSPTEADDRETIESQDHLG